MQQVTFAVKTLCDAVNRLPQTDAPLESMVASGIDRGKYDATLPIRQNLQKAVSFLRVFTNEAAAAAFQEIPQSISDAILQDLRKLSEIAKELPIRCQRQTTSMVPPNFNGQEAAVAQRVEQVHSRLYSNLLPFLAVNRQQDAEHEGSDAERSPSTGRRDESSDRFPPTPTSGLRLTPHANQDAPSKEDASNQDRRKEIVLYALISLISFLCGVALLGLMIWKAELLARFGLAGNLYYLVLLPMGLAAAGFLFGVLRSYARYSGKQFGGMLELGGPIVAFLLVLILGFVLVKPATTFPFTVFVHGERGDHDLVLKHSGYVYLDLGGYRQKEPIGENGQAIFLGIPPAFRGQEVPIGVESGAFELSDPKQKCRLDGSSIYLSVQRKAGHLSGRVQDDNGNPIPSATIQVAGLSKITDSAGHFDIVIPGDRLQPELDLDAVASGYSSSHLKVVPNGNDVVIPLTRTR